ncbi:MAG: hypothetical protein B6I24_01050 [Bacteroidetes bacterium 4572_128]|nr:MAG: hypothetical protein B6I24_01050 [Bacteroidetes bacterium 4572_128]
MLESQELNKKRVKELREIARSFKIRKVESFKKKELIEEILKESSKISVETDKTKKELSKPEEKKVFEKNLLSMIELVNLKKNIMLNNKIII